MENKLEVFEASPRPSEFTLWLLEKIYEENGPVDRVYKKHGVKYKYFKYWKLVEGILYTDREIEKKTVPLTVKNIWNLTKINASKEYERLRAKLKETLETNLETEIKEKAINNLLTDYEIIFEINVLYQKVIGELEAAIKEKKWVNRLLVSGSELIEMEDIEEIVINQERMVGNSLEVDDRSKFRMTGNVLKRDTELMVWWKQQPQWKKEYLAGKIRAALKWEKLREEARWLTVRDVSLIRPFIDKKQITKSSKDITNKRGSLGIRQVKGVGVSAGRATGMVVEIDEIAKMKKTELIMWTEVLAPELTDYLGKVRGVVAKHGSMLSHLAIVAREMNVPVVVGVELGEGFDIGDEVLIDGESGEINRV